MNILFDQGTPVPLRKELDVHQVDTAYEKNWSDLDNSELLDKAENETYDLLITTDQNLYYQQDLSDRSLAVVVLTTTSWPRIQQRTDHIKSRIKEVEPGTYNEIKI